MNKIGVVGEFESTAYFGTMGAEVFFVNNGEAVGNIVKKLVSGGYAIIFVDEKYFEFIDRDCYSAPDKPAVIPLALSEKSKKIGKKIMKDYIRGAAGADIVF